MLRAALPRSWPLLAPGRDGDLGHFLPHAEDGRELGTSGGGGGGGGGGGEGEDGSDEGACALRAELAAARARLREMLLTAGMGGCDKLSCCASNA